MYERVSSTFAHLGRFGEPNLRAEGTAANGLWFRLTFTRRRTCGYARAMTSEARVHTRAGAQQCPIARLPRPTGNAG